MRGALRIRVKVRDDMREHLTTAFRDDGQLAEVCKVLCEHASLPGMWVAASGPTARSEQFLATDCEGLSAGQRVVFLAAWELWDRTGSMRTRKRFTRTRRRCASGTS